MPDSASITGLLERLRGGDLTVQGELIEVLYPELRKLAQHYMNVERPNHTLQATALVHEVYVRIFGSKPIVWQNRAHFFAVAAQQMRQILVDHARAGGAQKRGGRWIRLSLDQANGLAGRRDEDLVALDDALQGLEKLDARSARVVELRFFAGLTEKEAAEVMGVSVSKLKRDWEFARAWLFQQLGPAVS